MKKLFLILFLFICTNLSAQNFAPIGARWYYGASANGAAPGGSEYYLYESTIDTTVSGHSCNKIVVTYFQYSGAITNPFSVFVFQSGDTVFYFNNTYAKYFPLYIFNVIQGDTLVFHSPSIPINPADSLFRVVVDSVTTLIVGTTQLQRVWTKSIDNFSLGTNYAERIGSNWLMLHQPSIVIPEWDGPARCYTDSSISYQFSTTSCDHWITDGIINSNSQLDFSIFPNPSSGIFNLSFSKPSIIKSISVFNVLGERTFYAENYLNSELNLTSQSAGIYLLQLLTESGIENEILVINKY